MYVCIYMYLYVNIYFVYIASEWRSFLLYYIPTTLFGILPNKYYLHAILLTKALRILLADSISTDNVQLAQKLLMKFCRLYEDYYGIINATCNRVCTYNCGYINRNRKLQCQCSPPIASHILH